MKRWTKGTGIAITTIMLVAMQATMVLARSGGGKGGSLGGSAARSYSGSVGGGLSSGGYSSGLGFNSMAPFFLLGGSSAGGGGASSGSLFSLLFMLLVFYLIYKALRSSRLWPRGNSKQRGSSATQGSGWFGQSSQSGKKKLNNYDDNSVVDLSGRQIDNSSNLNRFSSAIAFTRENMQHYNETFSRWDRAFLTGRVRQVFYWFQDAWSRQDLSQASDYLAPNLISKYSGDLNGMKQRGERNMIKEPDLNADDIEFIHSNLGADGEHFTVMVYASLVDYTVDTTGRLISGDDKHRLYFTEFWEFSWLDNQWVLSNIYQEDSLEVAQIARGEHN